MSAGDSSTNRDEPQDLQFDRVETTRPRGETGAYGDVTCVVCRKSVGAEYYAANDKPVCGKCRQVLISAAETPRSAGTFIRAAVFGFGAAIAGAAIYYAVIAIIHWEIAIVAILIGYMVGYAVRTGTEGRGGRRFQILAVVLTYWAVGLAYVPLAFKGNEKKPTATSSLTADSAAALGPTIGERLGDTTQLTIRSNTAGGEVSNQTSESGRSPLTTIGGLFLLSVALPVLSIVGSMPSGLISALIIIIGMRQAWVMTARPKLQILGPYEVGGGTVPVSA